MMLPLPNLPKLVCLVETHHQVHDQFKGLAMMSLQNGSTCFLWLDFFLNAYPVA
jgi:hypothetical protein